MKLTNLNDSIKDFAGQPVRTPGGEICTRKIVLVNLLGRMRPGEGKATIMAYVVGGKVQTAGDSCELNSEEGVALKGAVEQNAAEYNTLVIGQLLLYLENMDAPAKPDAGGK